MLGWICEFTDRLSQAWGVGTGASSAQYVAWSASAGLFSAMSNGKGMTVADLCAATFLNEDGVDSLLPILMALGLASEDAEGFRLTRLAEEYFLPQSPYYVGPGLFWGCDLPMPSAYLHLGESGGPKSTNPFTPPKPSLLLRIQLSRNLAPGVCAARSGRFRGIRHLIDIGGGAGSIAIPFALDNPDARVTLVELPQKLDGIGEIIRSYDLEKQFELRAMDVLSETWRFPPCDGMLFGNFFHAFPDGSCRALAQQCFGSLAQDGRIFLHEVLFNESRTGPLIAALWNANMHVIGGRQRTATECFRFLRDAGFSDLLVTPTASRFSLIEGRKPGLRS